MANAQDVNPSKRPAPPAISRRGFLRAAGAVGGAAMLGGLFGVKPALAVEDFRGYPDRYGMLTDTTMCIGCRMCEMACAKANDLPAPPTGQEVFATRRRPAAGAFTVVNRYENPSGGAPIYRKVQCMHCDEPACASACLVGALKKTPEGPVIYNEDICIGCRYCMVACPFSNLAYDYDSAFTPAVRKCIMCRDRLLHGEGPACATACPTKATIHGKRSELLAIAHERIRQNPDKYVPHVFGEDEAGGTGWLYLAAVPFDRLGLPTNIGRTPYPEFTRDFLLAVPLVLMMWPGALAGLNAVIRRKERHDAQEATKQEEKEEGRR